MKYILLQLADINNIDIIEHIFAVEPSENDDLSIIPGISRVPLPPVHKSQAFARTVLDRHVPRLVLQIETNLLIRSHLAIITSEDIQTIPNTIRTMASQSTGQAIFVFDLSPSFVNGVKFM
jgi:hypothetical protein